MHINQYADLADIVPLTEQRRKAIGQPFCFKGWTYTTDGRCIIRTPGFVDGAVTRYESEPDPKVLSMCKDSESHFNFFRNAHGDLVSFDTLKLEPVLRRRGLRSDEPDYENPSLDRPEEFYTALGTPVQIHGRYFDARRMLFLRQTLPSPLYYDDPEAGHKVPLYFVFGANNVGQGVLMPVMPGQWCTHWNGAHYLPGS